MRHDPGSILPELPPPPFFLLSKTLAGRRGPKPSGDVALAPLPPSTHPLLLPPQRPLACSSSPPLPPLQPRAARALLGSPSTRLHHRIHSLSFHSSSMLSDRRADGGEERKMSPDVILFEGCDYNHWLITMDFPKDPAPTREEMIETYIQTLAKVVGSVEEAKKRMYAFSTTTYTGFQAVMTEEMSEKF